MRICNTTNGCTGAYRRGVEITGSTTSSDLARERWCGGRVFREASNEVDILKPEMGEIPEKGIIQCVRCGPQFLPFRARMPCAIRAVASSVSRLPCSRQDQVCKVKGADGYDPPTRMLLTGTVVRD